MRKSAIRTKGSHGPSGLDPDFRSKILCNSIFGNASDDLCHAIALLARMLCFEELVDPKSIEGLTCRLVPLDKSSGIRPIGIDEVLRRIVGNHWQSYFDSVKVGYIKRYWLPTFMCRVSIRMRTSSSCSSGSFLRR